MELNPNHPVTTEVREQWHKLCALVILKSGVRDVTITAQDIDAFMSSG